MQRVKLSSQVEFSQIIYGMWRLKDDKNISTSHIQKKIELCLEQGITTFDQADIYGDYGAEEIFGNVLKRDKALREKIEIITKCNIIAPIGKYQNERLKYYDTSSGHIKKSVDASLQNMGIDCIDLLLLHRPDPFMDAKETGDALDEIIKSGKVRSVGTSNFRPWDWSLLQASMKNKLITNQIEFSLINHEPLTNGDLSFHYQERTSVMAWSPLAGGALMAKGGKMKNFLEDVAKRYSCDPASVALSWIIAHPSKILPVVGTNNLERISKLVEATEISIDRKTWFELYSAAIEKEVP